MEQRFDAKEMSKAFALPRSTGKAKVMRRLDKHVYENIVTAKVRRKARAKNKAARATRQAQRRSR